MMNDNIIKLFIASARKCPECTALIYNNTTVSYDELLLQVQQTAATFKEKGVNKGDRILVYLPASIELYRAVLALLYVGACPILPEEYGSLKSVIMYCETLSCKGIVTSNKVLLASMLTGVLRNIPLKIKAGETVEHSTKIESVNVQLHDTALIVLAHNNTATDFTHEYLLTSHGKLQPLLNNDVQVSLVTWPIVVLVTLAMGKTILLPPPGFSTKKPETTGMIVDEMITWGADEMLCPSSLVSGVCKLAGEYEEFVEQVRYIFTDAVNTPDAAHIANVFHKAVISNKVF